uniref:Uncharacterized protein LOC105125483 n=1 Tax=Rhizophora mucronata TaxID=61149 RepID=A0A2P2JK65_RHIMU
MPSVGMRRSTRVFGVVKGVDGGGARVLRSGRRLWPDPVESKLKKKSGGGDYWLPNETKKPNNGNSNKKNHNLNGAVKSKQNGWAHDAKLTKFKKHVPSSYAKAPSEKAKTDILVGVSETKKFGVVYTRKRKRENVLTQENLRLLPRQQRDCQAVFAAVIDRSCGFVTEFTCFLSLVLGYLKRSSLRLSELAAFLFSEPISGAFTSNGIRFLRVRLNSFPVKGLALLSLSLAF